MNDNQIKQTYLEETLEYIRVIEKDTLMLEKNSENPEYVNEIFRALHTIKGTSSMLGYEEVSDLTHIMETHFDKIRSNQSKINAQLISMTLAFCDSLKIVMTAKSDDEKNDEMEHIRNILNVQVEEHGQKITDDVSQLNNESDVNKVYRIYFQPTKKTLMRGHDPVKILNQLRGLGTCYVIVESEQIPLLGELDDKECYMVWGCILVTPKDLSEIQDVFQFVKVDSQVDIELIDEGNVIDDINYKRLGEILVNRRRISPKDVEKLLSNNTAFGELAIKRGLISKNELNAALLEQNIVREERKKRNQIFENMTIRVKNDKLDELVNLVGELVTLEAQLKQFSASMKNTQLNVISDRLNRLIGELRENSLNIRMIPLNHIFSTFNRLIRDLSIQEKKEVQLKISGGETEVDKNVIESLKDPLLHIIRNCVGHGIEFSEERIKQNKDKVGTISISAQYSGAYVRISIKDDGKGLDLELIRNKAMDLKMIHSDVKLTDEQILNFIFRPGFSTSQKLSKISGRGVGMDVVKKNIEKLRGFITINSKPGEGTELIIKIPLTLAIIDGLLFVVADSHFIINLSSVVECLDCYDELFCNPDGNAICYRDLVIPCINMAEFFNIQRKTLDMQQIIVVRVGDKLLALQVDRALRKHQTVIKSVSQVYSHIEEVSGATVLGDGHIALILDISKIAEKIEGKIDYVYNEV
ncbi:MAG: chemotaxis protein CheA [Spirochaetales bacterium]|nr:chemotaxis protein CheA [Spirochaetales bacterium]